MEQDQPNNAYDLRHSRSVPAILRHVAQGFYSKHHLPKPNSSSLQPRQIQIDESELLSEDNSSVDSLLLVVFDQVTSYLTGLSLTGAPACLTGAPVTNKSDVTFLLDMEGGGGLCFQPLLEESEPK